MLSIEIKAYLEQFYKRSNMRGQSAVLRFLLYSGMSMEKLMNKFKLEKDKLIEALDSEIAYKIINESDSYYLYQNSEKIAKLEDCVGVLNWIGDRK